MSSATGRRLTTLLVAAIGALVFASAASAATSPFGCRASLAAERLSVLPTVEPYVANRDGTSCATDTSGLASGTLLGSVASGTVALAGPAGAYTYSTTSADPTLGPVATGAAALASVRGATIVTPSGSLIVVGPAEAQASYQCVNGSVVSKGSSTLALLKINGTEVALPGPEKPLTIPLGGGAYVAINQQVQTATSLTERVLIVHLASLGDIVVGEAAVTQPPSGACATSTGGGGGGPNACPPGSTFVPASQVCEIVGPGQTIIVNRPFAGETGGTVVPLAYARKHYKSGCLYGPGPQYAIIGTNGPDRIEGTRKGDRILSLGGNDRVAGHGGNDCIDGGAGNDRIYGGNGNDRIYGGNGTDRISVQNGSSSVWGGAGSDRIFLGNGSDHVWGGSGNDRISVGRGKDLVWGGAGSDTVSTGNGNDSVWGGAGNDTVYAGTGHDHLYGGSGNDRLYGPGLVMYANCGSGNNNVAYVNIFGMHYAAKHGCQSVRKIHTHTL